MDWALGPVIKSLKTLIPPFRHRGEQGA